MEYAKCDKSLLNYCHVSQLEPRITQLPYKKAPGLCGVHFLQYGAIYVLKRTSYLMVFIFCSTGLFMFSSEPHTSWCLFFAVRGYFVPHGVHFLQYGVIYVLKRTSYLVVFIFCSTGLFTFSSEPRTSWCSFFAVRGYLRSQVNLVPCGVHFLQYRVVYVLKRTSYLSGADYVMLCIVHEKMMQCM